MRSHIKWESTWGVALGVWLCVLGGGVAGVLSSSSSGAVNEVNPNVPPARGWNPADSYPCPNQTQTMQMAKHLVDQGWRDLNYTIITLDGGWWLDDEDGHVTMDSYGRYFPSVRKYPCAADGRGLRCLVEMLQPLGIQLGIWILRGVPQKAASAKLPILGSTCTADAIVNMSGTCTWLTSMNYGVDAASVCGQAYYHSIAALYKEWGLALLKADCFYGEPEYPDEIAALARAVTSVNSNSKHDNVDLLPNHNEQGNILNDTPLLLSWSPGNNETVDEANWAVKNGLAGHMYRITGDVWDYWWHIERAFDAAVRHSALINVPSHSYLDLDILPFGFGYGSDDAPEPPHYSWLTKSEQRVAFTLWCFIKSPLFIGALLPTDGLTIEVMQNRLLLQVQAYSTANRLAYISTNGRQQVWCALPPSSSSSSSLSQDASSVEPTVVYVAAFNIANDTSAHVLVDFTTIGFSVDSTSQFELTDMWEGTVSVVTGKVYDAYLDQHDVQALVVRKK